MNIATISKQIRAFADQLDATSEPEKPDPYAELKAAHTAGKVIQGLIGGYWIDSPHPTWKYPVDTYRVKPTESAKPEPAFQLPPPPPGMRWHREDGWKADDLPNGYRPLVFEEQPQKGDEYKRAGNYWEPQIEKALWVLPTHDQVPQRTTRPLVFNHAGKTWTWHRPGDPMPCDGERIVAWLMRDEDRGYLTGPTAESGCKGIPPTSLNWEADTTILGWRYAEPQTKTVPLGPEDVPPCSAIRGKESKHWFNIVSVHNIGISISSVCGDIGTDKPTWGQLAELAEINRSIPLTGKWNPDAWEPCSKEIPA